MDRHDLDPGKDLRKIYKVKSAIECQKHCQIDAECRSFVFHGGEDYQVCYLKRRNIDEAERIFEDRPFQWNAYVSGPKHCGRFDRRKIYGGCKILFMKIFCFLTSFFNLRERLFFQCYQYYSIRLWLNFSFSDE